MIWIANVSVQLPGYKVDDSRIGVKSLGLVGILFFPCCPDFILKCYFSPLNQNLSLKNLLRDRIDFGFVAVTLKTLLYKAPCLFL
jgi:hypothetical protein